MTSEPVKTPNEKIITVLECILDVESVLKRYAKKGWEPIGYVTDENPPKSIRIHLRKLSKHEQNQQPPPANP